MSVRPYHERVREIRKLLTPETWGKNSYFTFRGGRICHCVHGAGQLVINPAVKSTLSGITLYEEVDARREQVESAISLCGYVAHRATDAFDCIHSVSGNDDLRRVWAGRARRDSDELHYLLGMFGLTAAFNDSAHTTLEMVWEKLDQCAVWAEENADFLRNN